MAYPKSERLGHVRAPDGHLYSPHFYGESERAAVVTGPVPENTLKLEPVPEIHREPATDRDDALEKLRAWLGAHDWADAEWL